MLEVIDAKGKMILPAWCDSHTHIVYAGSREEEFKDRINGLSYEEIAANGGGILNSAKTLQTTSENDLYEQSKVRLEEVMALGTGAIEIKSGRKSKTEIVNGLPDGLNSAAALPINSVSSLCVILISSWLGFIEVKTFSPSAFSFTL